MTTVLRPMLEMAVVFPAALLCLLPVRAHLRYARKATACIALGVLLPLVLGGGALCALYEMETSRILYPALPLLAALYARSVRLPTTRTVSLFLSVLGVFSCLCVLATAADAMFRLYNVEPWFSIRGALVYNLLGWGAAALLAWPVIRRVPYLLTQTHAAQAWSVFWVLPAVFIALNLLLRPADYRNIRVGRMMPGYIAVEVVYLSVLLLFYLLFYFLVRGLEQNSRLQQENAFLQMQTAQYEALRSAIAETRHARHDLRHHVNAISTLADREDWTALRRYAAQMREALPTAELTCCDNPAVDAVAGHYAVLCQRAGIALSCTLDLPPCMPVAEMDMCVVLSNLMENALEASACVPPQARRISARAHLHEGQLALLTVENAYAGEIREENGVFHSSKHTGEGIGLQSVRRIAEKNGGYCRFAHQDGVFVADVMLRGTPDIKQNDP